MQATKREQIDWNDTQATYQTWKPQDPVSPCLCNLQMTYLLFISFSLTHQTAMNTCAVMYRTTIYVVLSQPRGPSPSSQKKGTTHTCI